MVRAIAQLTVAVWITLALLAACGPTPPTLAPAPSGAATSAPASKPAGAPAGTVAPAAGAPTAKVKRGGVLRDVLRSSIDSLDAQLTSLRWNWETLVYDTFLSYKYDPSAKKFDLGPGLAESYTVVNPTTLDLKLRKGVKFHDGTDFNAAVAKWNLDRAVTHPKSTVRVNVSTIKDVQVVDDYTLRVNLKVPSAVLPLQLSPAAGNQTVGVVSKDAVDMMGDEKFASSPVGSGPMKFKEWVRDQRLVLEKFPGHWEMGEDGQPLPYLDGYAGQLIIDQNVAMIEVRTGNIDTFVDFELKDVATVKGVDSLKVGEVPSSWNGYPGFAFNNRKGTSKFSENQKLREAAGYAVDHQSMANALAFGLGRPSYYPFMFPGMPGYDENLPRREFNLEKAKALVAEAGFPNGVEVETTAINRPLVVRPLEVLQGMWSKAGIRLMINALDRLPWIDAGKSGRFESLSQDWNSYPDIIVSQPTRTDSAGNWSGYSNPEVDKLWAQADGEYDSNKRAEIYKKIQTLVYEDAYHVTAYMHPAVVASQKGVQNYTSKTNYRYIWKE